MYTVYEHDKFWETEGRILNFRDLMQAQLHDDQLTTFPNEIGYIRSRRYAQVAAGLHPWVIALCSEISVAVVAGLCCI